MEKCWFTLILALFAAGCATSKPAAPPADFTSSATAIPAVAPVAVVPGPVNPPVPALQAAAPVPEPVAEELSKPIVWDNSDIADWTEQRYPKPGDGVELMGNAQNYTVGVVLQSAAKKEGGVTTVLLVLDLNGDDKPDKVAKILVEEKEDGVEIKTAIGNYKE